MKHKGSCHCGLVRFEAELDPAKPADFQLLTGLEDVSQYEWGANLNCMDDLELSEVRVMFWDGRHDNWQVGPRSTPWPMTRASG
jgi:hypothetical protein